MYVRSPLGPLGYCQTVSPAALFMTLGGRPRRASTSDIDAPGGNEGGSSEAQPAASSAAAGASRNRCSDVIAVPPMYGRGGGSARSTDDPDRRGEERIFLLARPAHPPGGGVEVYVEEPVGRDRDLVPVGPDLLAQVAIGHDRRRASEPEPDVVPGHSGANGGEVLPGQRLGDALCPAVGADRDHVGELPRRAARVLA